MIIDTSAVMAVLLGEEGADDILALLVDAPTLDMSAATYLECTVVLDRRVGPASRARFSEILRALDVRIVDFTHEQADVGREAYRRYGKGSGHPAGLNLGDCFSYALSATTGEPLLFVGDDFTHTDLVSAR